jgi:small-conductance mechanosensitive channel
VLQRALGDFYVEYELRAKVDAQHSRFRVPSDLHAAIQDAFNEADVQILSPHFEAQPAEKVVSPPTAWRTPPGDRFA